MSPDGISNSPTPTIDAIIELGSLYHDRERSPPDIELTQLEIDDFRVGHRTTRRHIQ